MKSTGLCLLLSFLSSPAFAQAALFEMIGGVGSPPKPKSSIQLSRSETQDLDSRSDSQKASVKVIETGVGGSTQIFNDESGSHTLGLGTSNLKFNIVAPAGSMSLPTEMNQVDFFWSQTKSLDAGRAWGTQVAVGSAGDSLFRNLDETNLTGTAYYRTPDEQNQWVYLVNFSNNRSVLNNIPIPGAAYVIPASSNKGVAVIGFPFLFGNYKWDDKWSMRILMIYSSTTQAEFSYQPILGVRFYSSFDWRTRSYRLKDRETNTDRLFLDQKALNFGVNAFLSKNWALDLVATYLTDRDFIKGVSWSNGSQKMTAQSASQIQVKLTALQW